ncbi:LysR substrate-binding domain-containing protein [Streptomyces sp. RFCAC02]|uniref:LysR substrate-binding domain-containing protein n=1 Tax=Streptomyces sp. RFCAC02 TaxID=2499143 RepID=UPI0019D2B59F|nr:LysR substrate-binding domain-containing protein [Streptomyces sp. RFCAC02]
MELRDIEIFLALAEELHFGRTAEKLHISQARVSQSIAKQERRIGAALFERSSRRVALTAIGARLYDDLKAAHRGILEATRTATAAARGVTGTLTVGAIAALVHDLADAAALFRARHPSCELRLQETPAGAPFDLLRGGEVDLQLLWLPVREPDLSTGPVLRRHAYLLAVGADHPLARRTEVSMEDLGDWEVVAPPDSTPAYWAEQVVPTHTPGGRPVRRGPRTVTWQPGEVLAEVAAGRAVEPIMAPATQYYPWPGVVYLPITDAPTCDWVLTWRTADETPLVRAFVRAAQDSVPDAAAGSA